MSEIYLVWRNLVRRRPPTVRGPAGCRKRYWEGRGEEEAEEEAAVAEEEKAVQAAKVGLI